MANLNFDPQQSRAILQALRDGQVPEVGAPHLCVGREELLQDYESLLLDIQKGTAATKFIRGDYGYGKSMLLKVFEEIARQRSFAVARVKVSAELPFNRLEEFYRKIAREITATSNKNTFCGIGDLLRCWLHYYRRQAQSSAQPYEDFSRLNQITKEKALESLREVRQASPAFAKGVEAYLEGALTNNEGMTNAAIAWLRQDVNMRAGEKRLIGVKGDITKENAWEFLQALVRFVRWVPFAGTIILIDEVEFIRYLPQDRLREIAFDNIRSLWDACNDGGIKYSLFIYAATGEMFTDARRGFASYPALAERMSLDHQSEGRRQSLKWPVIELELLQIPQAKELARKVISIYSTAEGGNHRDIITDQQLEDLADQAYSELIRGIKPRDFVRALLRWLDDLSVNMSSVSPETVRQFEAIMREVEQEDHSAENQYRNHSDADEDDERMGMYKGLFPSD